MSTIVVGLGNPILSDDGIGIRVARTLRARAPHLDVVELGAGGIRVLDVLPGYRRAFIVDATVGGGSPCGTISRFTLDALVTARTRNTLCVHDMDLPTAIELGRRAGLDLPTEVRIWGVEAYDVETFGEALSGPVEAALPIVVDEIIRELSGESA